MPVEQYLTSDEFGNAHQHTAMYLFRVQFAVACSSLSRAVRCRVQFADEELDYVEAKIQVGCRRPQ